MKKFTILSFVLLTSCVGTSLFAAEGSGSSSSASSSGDHASSSSGAEAVHAAILRKLIESPEFHTFNEQVAAYIARLRGIVADGGVGLFSGVAAEHFFDGSAELMRTGILGAIDSFLARVVSDDSAITVRQFARKLLLIAQFLEDILLLCGKNFERNHAFVSPLLRLRPREINVGLFLPIALILKDDDKIAEILLSMSVPVLDPQLALLGANNIEKVRTARGLEGKLTPEQIKAIFCMLDTSRAHFIFCGSLLEKICY
jgi:hypothetical protein